MIRGVHYKVNPFPTPIIHPFSLIYRFYSNCHLLWIRCW